MSLVMAMSEPVPERFMSYDASPGYAPLQPRVVGSHGQITVVVRCPHSFEIWDGSALFRWWFENHSERPANWAEDMRRKIIESGASTAEQVYGILIADCGVRFLAWLNAIAAQRPPTLPRTAPE